MKRTLVALAIAALAAPAFAAEITAPYEQTQVDRTLPNVPEHKGQASTESNPWANDFNFIAPAN
jgi:hypothetical protein